MSLIPPNTYRYAPPLLPIEFKYSNFALRFNGVDQFIRVLDHASLEPAALTLEAWIRPSVLATSIVAVKHYPGATPNSLGYGLTIANALGQITVLLADGIAADWLTWTVPGVFIPALRWNCIGFTFNQPDVRFYLNGLFQQATVWNHALAFGAENFYVGIDYDEASRPFNGLIDGVRLIPSALSDIQMLHSFLRGYMRRELNARLVLRFEEGVGLTANDLSGYGNNGTLLPAVAPPTWRRVSKYELLAEAEMY